MNLCRKSVWISTVGIPQKSFVHRIVVFPQIHNRIELVVFKHSGKVLVRVFMIIAKFIAHAAMSLKPCRIVYSLNLGLMLANERVTLDRPTKGKKRGSSSEQNCSKREFQSAAKVG